MTYEEKLDLVLKTIVLFNEPIVPHLHLYDSLASYKLTEKEIESLINKLVIDGHIERNTGLSCLTTIAGKMFLKNGGYVEQRKRDDELYHNSRESAKFSRKAYYWVVIGTIISLLAVFISIATILF